MSKRALNLRAATWAVVLLAVSGVLLFALPSGDPDTPPGEEQLPMLGPGAPEIVIGILSFLVVVALMFFVIRAVVARAYRRGSSRTSD